MRRLRQCRSRLRPRLDAEAPPTSKRSEAAASEAGSRCDLHRAVGQRRGGAELVGRLAARRRVHRGLDGVRRGEHGRLGDPRRGGERADLLVQDRVVDGPGRGRVLERAAARAHHPGRVGDHRAQDARDQRVQVELQERHVAGGPRLEARAPRQDVVGVDHDVGERRRPRAGAALPHAVPVVDHRDARAVGRDHHGRHEVALDPGRDGDPVRVEGPGAVVLRAVEHEAPVNHVEACVVLVAARRGRAGLRDRVAEHRPGADPVEPAAPHVGVRAAQEPEHLAVVGAQDVGDDRVGLGEVDDEGQELAHRRALPALVDGQRQRAQPRLRDGRDLRERALVAALALRGALGDPGQERADVGGAGRGAHGGGGRRHAGTLSRRASSSRTRGSSRRP